MGYIRHHAIIVTGSTYPSAIKRFEQAHRKASELFGPLVTGIVPSLGNDFSTFLVVPDGSKESWPMSDEHDLKRQEFTEFLDALAYGDGSSHVHFVEVAYDEEHKAGIIKTNKERPNEE